MNEKPKLTEVLSVYRMDDDLSDDEQKAFDEFKSLLDEWRAEADFPPANASETVREALLLGRDALNGVAFRRNAQMVEGRLVEQMVGVMRQALSAAFPDSEVVVQVDTTNRNVSIAVDGNPLGTFERPDDPPPRLQ